VLLACVETTKHGSTHRSTCWTGTIGVPAAKHSTAALQSVEERSRPWRELETQQKLDFLGLNKRILARRYDEETVMLKQGLVGVMLACEALGEASSCPHHGFHRHKTRWTENGQNEQNTDLWSQ
jgi:hypothetical protein